jgi:hypothetical protein
MVKLKIEGLPDQIAAITRDPVVVRKARETCESVLTELAEAVKN